MSDKANQQMALSCWGPGSFVKNHCESHQSTRMGFEPTRAEHNGLAVHRLNHSAKDRAKGTASRGKEKEKGGRKGGKEREGKEKIIISITFHEHSERI